MLVPEYAKLALLLAKELRRTVLFYHAFKEKHSHFDYKVGCSKTAIIRLCEQIRMVCGSIIKELKTGEITL